MTPLTREAPGRMAVRTGRGEQPNEARLIEDDGTSVSHTTVKIRIPGTLSTITIDLERLLYRWIEDTILSLRPQQWIRRAEEFEAIGTPSADETALACRNHARLLGGEFGDVDL